MYCVLSEHSALYQQSSSASTNGYCVRPSLMSVDKREPVAVATVGGALLLADDTDADDSSIAKGAGGVFRTGGATGGLLPAKDSRALFTGNAKAGAFSPGEDDAVAFFAGEDRGAFLLADGEVAFLLGEGAAAFLAGEDRGTFLAAAEGFLVGEGRGAFLLADGAEPFLPAEDRGTSSSSSAKASGAFFFLPGEGTAAFLTDEDTMALSSADDTGASLSLPAVAAAWAFLVRDCAAAFLIGEDRGTFFAADCAGAFLVGEGTEASFLVEAAVAGAFFLGAFLVGAGRGTSLATAGGAAASLPADPAGAAF